MKKMQDDILKVLLSEEEILAKVQEIGKTDYRRLSGQKPADGKCTQRFGCFYG